MNFKFGKKETKRCLAKIDAKLEKAIIIPTQSIAEWIVNGK